MFEKQMFFKRRKDVRAGLPTAYQPTGPNSQGKRRLPMQAQSNISDQSSLEPFVWCTIWRAVHSRTVTDIWPTRADTHAEADRFLNEWLARYMEEHKRGYFSSLPMPELWAVSEVDRVGSELRLPWAFVDETGIACKRSSGTTRGYWFTKEDAERYASDPNHPTYHGDVAELCSRCGLWHLSPRD